jgi:hypothetical protein
VRQVGLAGVIVGGLLTLSPLAGLAWTVVGMNHAFSQLGISGIGDPKGLSNAIGMVLGGTATGLLLLPAGLIILTISIIVYVRNSPASRPPASRSQKLVE